MFGPNAAGALVAALPDIELNDMKKDAFRNKVVVITGATGGVGRATAWEFAGHGARIALLARGAEQLEATKKEVESRGGEALAIECDVADYDQVENAAEQTERFFGPIDVWVNNAMNSVFAPFREIRADEANEIGRPLCQVSRLVHSCCRNPSAGVCCRQEQCRPLHGRAELH